MEMKFILYYTVAFYVIIFCEEDGLTYEHKVVSKPEAGQECSRRGGSLVNYKEIQNNTSASKYLDELENGDTAWIDGYAELSPFLYWLGCYYITDISNVYTIEMDGRSLALCSKECLRHAANTYHIGVKNTTCFCTESDPDTSPDFDMVSHSLCDISCSNNDIDSCGGDFHMSLYGIPRNRSWRLKEPINRQCIYHKLKSFAFEKFEEYTASCHTFRIDGFVCQEVKASVLLTASCTNTSTYRSFRDTKYCFKAEPSTRQEAHKHCLDINGRLASYGALLKRVGVSNHMYWSSLFRSIWLSDNHTSNAVCVAATKVNNIIYFEPDDCSVQKYFLCKYEKLTDSTSVTQQQARLTTGRVWSQALGTTESEQNSSSQATRITTSKLDSSTYVDPVIGYISLAVSVVALAVAAVIIILLYKFRMWIMSAVLHHINSGHRGEGIYPHPVQRNDENYSLVSSSLHYAVPECANRSPSTQSRHLTEQSGSQIPIAESSLVKEDLHTVELHHVYEGLSGDRQHATYEVISQYRN